MAKVRLYHTYYTTKSGKSGYTSVTADNKEQALSTAKRIGVKGYDSPKFTEAKFMRWVTPNHNHKGLGNVDNSNTKKIVIGKSNARLKIRGNYLYAEFRYANAQRTVQLAKSDDGITFRKYVRAGSDALRRIGSRMYDEADFSKKYPNKIFL